MPPAVFKDTYLLEFLDLPPTHSEADLQRALVEQLKQFLIELGRDFCFVGSQYPLQVGGRDFALDLLFFNRALNCLVAFELKVVEFEPEHLGKLQFYLEALDRDVRKPHEQAVDRRAPLRHEGPRSRRIRPEPVDVAALVAEYQTRLPDKKLLKPSSTSSTSWRKNHPCQQPLKAPGRLRRSAPGKNARRDRSTAFGGESSAPALAAKTSAIGRAGLTSPAAFTVPLYAYHRIFVYHDHGLTALMASLYHFPPCCHGDCTR